MIQNQIQLSKLEFSESVVQMLATAYDHNSHSSIPRYYSRKRIINEDENISKKQRNNNDHLAFSENARSQQFLSRSPIQ